MASNYFGPPYSSGSFQTAILERVQDLHDGCLYCALLRSSQICFGSQAHRRSDTDLNNFERCYSQQSYTPLSFVGHTIPCASIAFDCFLRCQLVVLDLDQHLPRGYENIELLGDAPGGTWFHMPTSTCCSDS